MAPANFKFDRMGKTEARKLVSRLMVDESCVVVPIHAEQRMEQRDVSLIDIINVLKSPSMRIVKEPDQKNSNWRYNCETNKFRITIAFTPDGEQIHIVTVMRRNQ